MAGTGMGLVGEDHGMDVGGVVGEGVGVGEAPPCALLDAWEVPPLAWDGTQPSYPDTRTYSDKAEIRKLHT